MSAVCDSCGSLLNADGAFCGNCGRVRTSGPARVAGPRSALIPAGAEVTHDRWESASPRTARPGPAAWESRTSATWRARPLVPDDNLAEADALAGQDLGRAWTETTGGARSGGRLGRIGVLGPAWLSAIAAVIVALTGAGFFAGRVSAPASPAAQPTKIITKTGPAAPPVSPEASAASASPSGAGSTAGNGTLLGSYSFQLTNSYSAPLGPTAPTQSQIVSGGTYDISYNGDIYPGTNEKMVSLPNGSTPTYSACTTGTVFEDSAPLTQGTTLCIIETSGRVAGVTITSIGSSSQYVVLKATLWKYVP